MKNSFKHMNIRSNAESISFYGSNQSEKSSLNQEFERLLSEFIFLSFFETIFK
jgi:ABC-type uncharacterized transport system fused permease/ATPase subunit